MQKRLRKLAKAACIGFASLSIATTSPAETIQQTMVDAYSNSNLLEQNRYLLRIQDEGVAQAVAQLRPILNFVAASSRDLIAETTTTTVSLISEYVIYAGGGRRRELEAARETVLAARQQLVNLEQQVLLDAATAYLNVWRDTRVVQVSERNVRVITQQLRAARDRFEVGEDTRTDVAQAEAQLAQARSNLAAAQGALEISRELFNLAVGRYPGHVQAPHGLPHLPRSEDEAAALARESHPAVRALQHEVAAAELAVEQARAAYRPRVTIDGSVSEALQNPNPFRDDTSASIGITLTQPIYQGGQLLSFERQARAQATAVRFSLNQQVLLNLQSAGNAWARVQIATAQIQAASQQIEAAQLAFEGVREEASLGARTTLDVLDAEQAVLDAQVSRIQAQTDLFVASYALLAASGLLTVERLNLPVPEYDPAAYTNAFSNAPSRISSPQGQRLDALLERLGRE